MITRRIIHNDFLKDQAFLNHIIENFETLGAAYGNQKRNTLKLFELNEFVINVKSFRIPNFINQIAYRFFRKSKAQRSFEYANKLITLGIGTPHPIAYYEFKTLFLFKNSYYISEQLDCDLTYRELTTNLNYPNHEAILRAFARFTYQLHQNGVEFLDHTPGNTLINKNGDSYDFYLVDLNRMQFRTLDFQARMKNFSRLTNHKSMVKVMSDEYAKCIGKPYHTVFNAMWHETEGFQKKFHRKKRLKQRLKF